MRGEWLVPVLDHLRRLRRPGIGIGLAAAGLAGGHWLYLNRLRAAYLAAGRKEPVAVAAMDLEAGAILRPEHIRRKDFPAEYRPPGAFQSPREILDGEGRPAWRLAAPIRKGEPVTRSRLTWIASDLSLAARIPSGRLASVLPLSQPAWLLWLKAGDSVDIFGSRTENGRRVTSLLIQNAPVLAATPAETGRAAIAVGLWPLETQILHQALENGSVEIGLRPPGDASVRELPPLANSSPKKTPAPTEMERWLRALAAEHE